MRPEYPRQHDRRRYPRARFSWRAAIGFKDSEDLVDGRTVDVSVGGVCVRGPIHAVPGDELLVLMGMKDRIVPALATVVLSEVFSAEQATLHMEFTWCAPSSRARLAQLTRVPRVDLAAVITEEEHESPDAVPAELAALIEPPAPPPPTAPTGLVVPRFLPRADIVLRGGRLLLPPS